VARNVRLAFEERHRREGIQVVEWDEMRETKGTWRSGPKFGESLAKKGDRLVNICGFMSPIDQFRNVTEFMLLPVPITCYFCDAPPMRDVLHVKLVKPADMVNEPVLIGGRLDLHEGPDQMFFYSILDAQWNVPVEKQQLTQKTLGKEHKLHHIMGFQDLREGRKEPDLVPGQELPAAQPKPGEEPVLTKEKSHIGGVPGVDMGELLPGQAPDASAPEPEAGGDDG